MLILIIAIAIIMIIVMWIIAGNTYYDEIPEFIGGCFAFIGLLAIIGLVVCAIKLVNYRVIDEKIKLYQNQNKNIEEKIELVVKEYKDYEKDTFKDLKADSYITLVNLYPELKTDEMVKQQIELYMKNNKKITSLKEDKITRTIYRWWVYFGK